MRLLTAFACVAILLGAPICLPAEQMPRTDAETLSGKKIEFPSVTANSVGIIFIGFTHASQSQMKAWTDVANKKFRSNPHVMIYDIAVLEDAPRLVPGIVVHGIKSGTPPAEYDHFVLVYRGEADSKRAAAFQRSEHAYMLVLDPKGEIKWASQEAPSDTKVNELTKQVAAVVPNDRLQILPGNGKPMVLLFVRMVINIAGCS